MIIIHRFVSTLVVKIADTISSTITDNEPKENARLILKEMKIYIINSNISKVEGHRFASVLQRMTL